MHLHNEHHLHSRLLATSVGKVKAGDVGRGVSAKTKGKIFSPPLCLPPPPRRHNEEFNTQPFSFFSLQKVVRPFRFYVCILAFGSVPPYHFLWAFFPSCALLPSFWHIVKGSSERMNSEMKREATILGSWYL